jgi:ribosomal protein L29
MIHPLVDLTELTDQQLESKIQELGRKYFMMGSGDIKIQIVRLLEIYKIELHNRRMQVYEQQFQKQQDKGLDNLINVN